MAERELFDLPGARVLAGFNELKLRAKSVSDARDNADAVGWRLQVPVENLAGSGWLGVLMADVIDANGVERVQLKLGFKLDPGPVLELYATRPGSAGNDADELRVFRFALDGIEFGPPLKCIRQEWTTMLRSNDGRVQLAAQDDGNLVLYVDGVPLKALFGLHENQLW